MPWIERSARRHHPARLHQVRRPVPKRAASRWMAYDHNMLLVPHGWNTAIGLAADLALAAATPVARWVEYLTPSPYIEEIVATPFKLDAEGLLEIPTGPGLGITLDPDAIARFSNTTLTKA